MTLVIMAAGMGSRFGGLKQIESVDSSGHILIDYSVYDAIKAGFDRIVFIIRRENEQTFKDIIAPRLKKWNIKIDLVCQELNDLPCGFICPKGREKPWGTAHAVASLSGAINEPFALINADDFYGTDAYIKVSDFLSRAGRRELCMIGYKLKNTLSENGAVSRGICRVVGGYLEGISEIRGIRKSGNTILSNAGELAPDSTVSMNFWGFSPGIIEECKEKFVTFLREKSEKELDVCEFYLPNVISELIEERKYRALVVESYSPWYGLTYREDRRTLMRFLDRMSEEGIYPADM